MYCDIYLFNLQLIYRDQISKIAIWGPLNVRQDKFVIVEQAIIQV